MKRLALALALLAPAGSCATVSSASIVPDDVAVANTQRGSVWVNATGTGRKLGLGRRLVSSEELAAAVRETLQVAGVFERVAEAPPADWRLDVEVLDLETPEWSLEMEVKPRLAWRLVNGAGQPVIARREIESRFVATPDHERDVEARGRHALEQALRRNLAEGARWLSELDLDAAPEPSPGPPG